MPQAAALATDAKERERQRKQAEKAGRIEARRFEAASRLPLCTTPSVPGRETKQILSIVAGHSVTARNLFSDTGSDIKSAFGGRLVGIEKAIESARLTAQDRLEQAARDLGADAVIGVDTSVQTVTDKAQLIPMVGTAVTLERSAAQRNTPPR